MTDTTTERAVTLAELQDRLKATPWRHTYNGIPIWEIGDDGEWLITVGHVDKGAFAKACDDYYRDVRDESLAEIAGDGIAGIAADVTHKKARIIHPNEFPSGEFEVLFDDGDVDVTVWTAP